MIVKNYRLFIDGRWVDSISGRTFESFNPATDEVNAIVAEAGPEDVDLAVKLHEGRLNLARGLKWHRGIEGGY